MCYYINFCARVGVKCRAVTGAGFGAAGFLGAVYFTDQWLGKHAMQFIPWIGSKYQNISKAPES